MFVPLQLTFSYPNDWDTKRFNQRGKKGTKGGENSWVFVSNTCASVEEVAKVFDISCFADADARNSKRGCPAVNFWTGLGPIDWPIRLLLRVPEAITSSSHKPHFSKPKDWKISQGMRPSKLVLAL